MNGITLLGADCGFVLAYTTNKGGHMRAFIALGLPEGLAREMAACSRWLATAIEGRITPPENHHLTLAFLGELDECGAEAAICALDEACAGRPPVLLEPKGLNTFGRGKERTLVLEFEDNPELCALAASVRSRLSEHWVDFDEKPFRPHITLARRVRLPKDLGLLSLPEAAWAADVTLYKSTLTSDGPIYKGLYTKELA